MNTIFLSIVLSLFNVSDNTNLTVAPHKTQINKTYLYQHWILADKESKDGVLTYRTRETVKRQEVSMSNLYGGMIFQKNGRLKKKRWIQCGNDRGPSHYTYRWKWKTQKDGTVLLEVKKMRTFKVLELSKNVLKVRAITQG